MQLTHRQSRFLLQFSPGSGISRLIDVHKTAGESPPPLTRLMSALDEEQLCDGSITGKDKTVGRDGRMRILIAIVTFHFSLRSFYSTVASSLRFLHSMNTAKKTRISNTA